MLPHLTRHALPDSKIPLIFIDTGFLTEDTYRAIKTLKNEGYNLQIFGSGISPRLDEMLYGRDLGESQGESFEAWRERRKGQPMISVLKQFKPDIWIGGRMRHQNEDRSNLPYLQRKIDFYQLNPIVDWTEEMVAEYTKRFNLPQNNNHQDYTKSRNGNGECPLWEI